MRLQHWIKGTVLYRHARKTKSIRPDGSLGRRTEIKAYRERRHKVKAERYKPDNKSRLLTGLDLIMI